MIEVKTDEYGEVINHKQTYKRIALALANGRSVIIGWTDQNMTHYDILFSFKTDRHGYLQRGLNGRELFVSIIGFGAFGFALDDDERVGSYISEKLNIKGSGEQINDLINGVIKALGKEQVD